MKTSDFEANFTAWLDGRLDPEKTAAFEQELRARGFDPAAERVAAEKTRALLRKNSTAPEMSHAEFFQHQLLHRIELADRERECGASSWWTLPQLAWAGAFSLLVAAVLFAFLIPRGTPPREASPYYATIVDARTTDPNVSVDTVYDARDNVTVVWIGGLDYMAGDIVAQ